MVCFNMVIWNKTYLNSVLMGNTSINMEDLSLSHLIAGEYEGIYSVNELKDGNNHGSSYRI